MKTGKKAMHLLHSFTSLYRVPITCHAFFEPYRETDNPPPPPPAWWKACSGGEEAQEMRFEAGGVATRTAGLVVPSPTEHSPTPDILW